MRALFGILVAVVGCGEDESYVIVSVDRRPAVHDAASLKVTLSNSGSMRTDDLVLAGADFPLTFSVSAPGRTGDLGIAIDALDEFGRLVGRGAGRTTLDSDTATVVLDSADFVINSIPAGNQFLSNDFEAVGLQLAATASGNWMAVFRDECTNCNILGRRFDATGLPVDSTIAASDQQFPVSTTLTTSGAIPTVAANGNTTLVFWDFFDTVGSGQGVACRTFNEQGAANPSQQTISTDTADVVTAAPLSNGNFVVTWQSIITTQVIRSIIVRPDCTTLTTQATTVSTNSGTFGARRSHVATNGTAILYTWIVDGNVHVRQGANNGTLVGAEAIPIMKTAALEADHVRIAPWGTGFALAVCWGAPNSMGPGKIEVYRLTTTGAIMGTPTLISDKSGSDFASDKAFGIAQRSDGALMVAWHMCSTGGTGSCDVFGRVLRPTGVPVGEEAVIATSTGSDQINPSVIALDATSFVAAWNDSSGQEPDINGSAVRGRILYPVYDDARGVIGATCGPSAPGAPDCGEDLACGMGSDGVHRCFATCTPPACPGGGACTTVNGAQSACVF